MTRTGLHLLLALMLALLAAGGTTAFADSLTYTFLTDPQSGKIQGTAGSTIGWGYSITNDSTTDWLVTANLAADVFADSTPDASPFDYPIVAPGSTVSLPYDLVTDTGLFALTWDVSAPIGFTNSGVFTLDAEWWTGDPFAGGTFIQDAVEEVSAYSATVSSPISSVPEPNAFFLLATALLAVFMVQRRVRKS